MCGSPLSCNLNGCAGVVRSGGVAKCEGRFRGCDCNPNIYTNGYCPSLVSCGFVAGCSGLYTQGPFGSCSVSNHLGCPCIHSSPLPTPGNAVFGSQWMYTGYNGPGCQNFPFPHSSNFNQGRSSTVGIGSVCAPVGFPGDWVVRVFNTNNQVIHSITSENSGCPGERPGNTGCFSSNQIGGFDVVRR